MSKFQRPVFCNTNPNIKIPKDILKIITDLTDKLTQDYVSVDMMMNNEAYPLTKADGDVFYENIYSSYKTAKSICDIVQSHYQGAKINEVEALKHIMNVFRKYEDDCKHYFETHPKEMKANLENHNSLDLKTEHIVESVDVETSSKQPTAKSDDISNAKSFNYSYKQPIVVKDLTLEDLGILPTVTHYYNDVKYDYTLIDSGIISPRIATLYGTTTYYITESEDI